MVACHAGGFDPDALDRPYAPLDQLARPLWLQSIINSRGDLAARLGDLLTLQQALQQGRLPPPAPGTWPLAPALAPFYAVMERLQLPQFAQRDASIAEKIVQTLLWHCDQIIDDPRCDDEAQAAQRAAEAFAAEWQVLAADIEEFLAMFETLGDLLKTARSDQSLGILHSERWQELVRIRKLLEEQSQLRSLIRQLGRAREAEQLDETSQAPLQVMEKQRTRCPQMREIQLPGAMAETRGVRRAGTIARMLPAEALLLLQPRLRLTWFARLAEQSLLVYEDQDRIMEPVWVESETWKPSPKPLPARKLEMGPMILCVDTSASMQGGAAQVAKAVVLEAMRTAAAQQRRCYVYAFGGPEEIIEYELPVAAEGIEALLAFMSLSYQGGTEISEPLHRATERIAEQAWRFADLVIASDGEFSATRAVIDDLQRAKAELGLRIQGILIGDRETIGMRQVCDDVFWVQEWRKYGDKASPTQHKPLTSLYFPGALG